MALARERGMGLWRLAPLLLFSGTAALILEVAWFRRTAQVAGATAVALAGVLAAVIGGMAIGAWIFGRFADRSRRPIRLYAGLELGVAAYALLTPFLLDKATSAFAWIHRVSAGLEGLGLGLSFLLSAALLACPAIFMGGTLPAAAAALRTGPERRGRDLGWLYAVNTLGGVLGTLLAGFFLLRVFGLESTMRIAASLSALAGVGALVLGRSVGRGERGAPPPRAPADPAIRRRATRAVFLYAASGFLGLVAEVAFTRSLVLVFGSTTYAFSTVLSVFLFGIAVGGAVGSGLARRNALRRLEIVVPVTAVLFALSALAIYLLPRLYIQGWLWGGGSVASGTWLRFILTALVLLPGSLGLGVAFPLAAHVATEAGLGRGTGRLYAWNTLLSVLGSTLAVFFLVPLLGMQGAIAVAALAVTTAIAVVVRRPALFLFIPVAALGLWPPSAPAQERFLSGVFHLPGRWVRDGAIDEEGWALGDDIPFHVYGREATVALTNWYGKPGILVDGKTVASAGLASDVHHLALLGHLPMVAHPDPRNVLIVGLGMGTTFEAVRLHQPPHLVVAELEPAVAEAARRLGIEPRNLALTDARTHLRATSDRYDVITSDPIHPWVRGGGDLYSLEYYRLCRSRLAEGGLMCQWVPLYQMGLEDVRDVMRTFLEAFVSVEAYFTGADLVLLGTAAGEVPAPRPSGSAVRQALEAIGAIDLDALLVGRREALLAATRSATVLTDDALRLEFSTPHQRYNPEMDAVLLWVRDLWGEVPAPWADMIEAQVADLRADGAGLSDAFDRMQVTHGDHPFVRQVQGEVYLNFVVDRALAGQIELAERFLAHAQARLDDDPRLLGAEGDLWEIAGDRERARRAFERLLELMPESRYVRRRLERLR